MSAALIRVSFGRLRVVATAQLLQKALEGLVDLPNVLPESGDPGVDSRFHQCRLSGEALVLPSDHQFDFLEHHGHRVVGGIRVTCLDQVADLSAQMPYPLA